MAWKLFGRLWLSICLHRISIHEIRLDIWRAVRSLFKLKFSKGHWFYILWFCFLCWIALFADRHITFVTSLFMAISAGTGTGLNVIDLKDLQFYKQLALAVCAFITTPSFIATIPIAVGLWRTRKYLMAFDCKISLLPPPTPATPTASTTASRRQSLPEDNTGDIELSVLARSPTRGAHASTHGDDPRVVREASPLLEPLSHVHWETTLTSDAHGSHPNSQEFTRPRHSTDREDGMEMLTRTISRNTSHTHVTRAAEVVERVASTMFVPVAEAAHPHAIPSAALVDEVTSRANDAQMEVLRANAGKWWRHAGTETHARVAALVFLITYQVVFPLLGFLSLYSWICLADPKYEEDLASQGVGKAWWAAYTSVSMFTNKGMTLTPDSMSHFADAPFPLLIITILQHAGNIMLPVFLRALIWIVWKLWPKDHPWREPIHYLLEHPRRCCLLLFPKKQTQLLLFIGIFINVVEAAAILWLNWNHPVLMQFPVGLDKTESLPNVGYQLVAIWFQAVNTRHTGAAVLNVAMLHPGVKILLTVLMYLSAYPIIIIMRASDEHEPGDVSGSRESRNGNSDKDIWSRARKLSKEQLVFDMLCLPLGATVINIIEGRRIEEDPNINLFSVIFETFSAYSNVGLSFGYAGTTTSLCAKFKPASQLLLCYMMLQGRHRGLPSNNDRAIFIPGEELVNEILARQAESGEAEHRSEPATEASTERTTEASTE